MLFKQLDNFVAAMLGMLAVVMLTQHGGVGISPDSIYYISAAHSVKEGQGFMQFDDTPFVLFPVLYPIFLLLVEVLTHQDIVVLAPYLNAFLFGIAIFVSSNLLEKMNVPKPTKWIFLIFIILSPSLLEIYTMLWSETLFIVEMLLFIWLSFTYFNNSSLKNLLLLASIVSIAAITRLAGVTIIATGALLILFYQNNKAIHKLKHLLIYSVVSCFLLALNLIRNFFVASSFTGARQKGDTHFLTNVKYFGEVLGDWMLVSKYAIFNAIYNALFLGLFFLIVCSFIFIFHFIKNRKIITIEKIAISFAFIYSMFMILSATFSKYETINNRLLAPLFIPIVLSVGVYFYKSIVWVQKSIWKFVCISFFIGVSVFVIFGYYNSFTAMNAENKEGGIGGYNDDDWVYSELLTLLKKEDTYFKMGMPVYSNASHAVYFFTQKHIAILPETKHTTELQNFYALPKNILIWLNNEDNPAINTLEDIQKHKNLTVLKQCKDGFIFLCTPK